MNAGTLDALHAFLAMGGYAGYVWGSLGMCALAFALEVAWLRARRRQVRAALAHAGDAGAHHAAGEGDASGPMAASSPAPAVRRPVVTRAPGHLVAEERP